MPLRRRGRQFRRRQRQPLASCGPPPGAARDDFERLVERALDDLPPHVARLLDNVAIVVEEEPTDEQRHASGLDRDESLYGLYEGTPAVEYAADWVAFPNKITLFRWPLEDDFSDPAELAAEVRRTVIHELAHHAGIDDERLEGYGLD